MNYKKTFEYNRWNRIKDCCLNKKSKKYPYYGGRGIKMYDDWVIHPLHFIEYIRSLDNYSKELSIDRIDNNGNYEPGNLRWVDMHTQQCNTRKRKDNTSGYVGIRLYKNNKYVAFLNRKNLGYYETIEEAVNVRNKYIIDNNYLEYKLQ